MNLASSESTKVCYFTASDNDAGQRLDNFLSKMLKGVPKSLIYRIIRSGEVRVNKGRVKPSYRLQYEDTVRIPPVRRPDPSANSAPTPSCNVLGVIESAILYEDASLIVIDKPSGVAVHGGSGLSYGLIEAVRALRPDASFLELVHRLDRETSGCILIAKKKSKLKTLHELMRAHSIEKKYIMLVKGEVTWKKKRVDLSLSKNILQSGERMVCVDEGGKEAVTHFGCLATGNGVSLLEATLETGRTHQLRVHCAALGHPILGDTKYGDREANKTCASYGLKRLYLHALSLRWRESNAIPEQVYVAPLPVLLSDLAARIMGHALPHIRIPSHATD